MEKIEEQQHKLEQEMAASASKGALVEKIVFAGVPILFSCVVYLMNSLSNANNEIIQLKSKIAVVVNSENKAIPTQGTTIEMAEIREKLSMKIDQVERDAALARANMTLDRERQLSESNKVRLEMTADAAAARALIRADLTLAIQKLGEALGDKIDAIDKAAALARAELDKRLTLLEKGK